MWRFARHGNAPANRGARDGKILQPALHKTQNFVSPALGTNEVGISGVKIKQLLLKSGKLEKIIFFGDGLRRASAIGAGIARAGIHDVGIVVHAILPGVMSFLNVAIFSAAFEEPLHRPVMSLIGGADEFLSGDSQIVPEPPPLRRDRRRILLR